MSDNEQNVTDGDFPVFKTRRKKASKKIVEDILPAEIYNQPAEMYVHCYLFLSVLFTVPTRFIFYITLLSFFLFFFFPIIF